MSLGGNEQTRLTAAHLNGLAVALFAVGGLAPLLARLYGGGDTGIPPLWLVMTLGGVCLVGSALLHLTGRRMLKRLTE